MATPTSRNDEFSLLIDSHLAIGCDELKVDGSFPVHIDVGFAVVSTAHTIVSVRIDTNVSVIKVFGIGGDGDDGQVIIVVAIDITACNDRTWEHACLEEAKAIYDYLLSRQLRAERLEYKPNQSLSAPVLVITQM